MALEGASTQVLIVGAGPVGLTLAIDLADHGVPFRIIDPLPEPSARSKAHGMQGRTVEMLAMLGLAQRLVDAAQEPPPTIEFRIGRRTVRLPAAPSHEPYPAAVPVMQQVVERTLEAALVERGHTVERSTELTTFEMDDAGVTAELLRYGGSVERARAAWLVGCDGAHSTTRKVLGLDMEGHTGDGVFWVTECAIEWDRPTDTWFNFVQTDGHIAAIYVEFTKRWHLFVSQREPDATQPDLARLNEILCHLTGDHSARLRDAEWIGTLRLNQRMPDHFIVGRSVLAGDAAHAHTAAGGQGMNTGVQDVLNLAWKLALATTGAGAPGLVVTYEAERLPNARQLLKDTEQYQRIIVPRTRFRRFTTWLLFQALAKVRPIQRAQIHRIGMFNQNHRGSELTFEGRNGKKRGPRAGDYLPHATCLVGGHDCTLWDLFHPQAVLLLVPGSGAEGMDALTAVERGVASLSDVLHVRYVFSGASEADAAGMDTHDARALIDVTGSVRKVLGLEGPEIVYVRPDGYIGLRSAALDIGALRAYLTRIYDPRLFATQTSTVGAAEPTGAE